MVRIASALGAMAGVWLLLSALFASYWQTEFGDAATVVPAFMVALLIVGTGWLLLYIRTRVFSRRHGEDSSRAPRDG